MPSLGVFGRNALVYALGNVVLRLGSFLLVPLYAHALDMDEFGMLANLLILAQLLMIVVPLGAHKAFIRFVPECQEKKEETGSLLGSALLIHLGGGAAVSALVLLLAPFFQAVFHTRHLHDLLWATCALALVQSLCLQILSFYRARNEGGRYMLASLSAFFLVLLSTVLCLTIFSFGVWEALVAQCFGYGLLGVVVFADVFPRTGLGFSSHHLRALLKFGVPLAVGMSADFFTVASTFFFLSYFVSLEAVAVYSVGFKLAQIAGIVLILPFQMALEPFLFSNLDKPGIGAAISRLLTYLMVAFVFVAFLIAFFSRELVALIGPPEYAGAYLLVLLLLPASAFRGIYYVGESLLHARNRTQITGTLLGGSALASTVLNVVLVSSAGVLGAVLAFVLLNVFIGLSALYFGLKVFPIPLEKARLGLCAGLLAGLLAFTLLLHDAQSYIYYSALPLLAGAGVAVLLLGRFFHPRERLLVRRGWGRLKDRARFASLKQVSP